MNPIILLIQPLLRRGLFFVASYFGYIGVTTAQQSTFVDALVPICVAAVLFVVDMVWAYFNRTADIAADPRKL
jgi:hypothetical protein